MHIIIGILAVIGFWLAAIVVIPIVLACIVIFLIAAASTVVFTLSSEWVLEKFKRKENKSESI